MFKAIRKRIEELDSQTEKLNQQSADKRAQVERMREENAAKLVKLEEAREELARMKVENEALSRKADHSHAEAEAARIRLVEKLKHQPAEVRHYFYEFARRADAPLDKPVERTKPPRLQ